MASERAPTVPYGPLRSTVPTSPYDFLSSPARHRASHDLALDSASPRLAAWRLADDETKPRARAPDAVPVRAAQAKRDWQGRGGPTAGGGRWVGQARASETGARRSRLLPASVCRRPHPHPADMPALLVNTAVGDAASATRPGSPTSDRPPVSPITPTATVAQLAPLPPDAGPRVAPPPAATFRQQPPSLPISESDNPDAIALRSAISLLQLQRDKSRRDLQALQELKHAAVADPHAFVRSLQDQRAQAARAHSDVLTPTLAGLTDTPAAPLDGHGHGQHGGQDDATTTGQRTDARKDSAHVDAKAPCTRFPAIPQPQNIVRCPPVEWAKYHIVGEPLDKMHEEQRKWPGSSEPPRIANGMRAPPHSVTAPYSPFKDGVAKSKAPSPSTSKPTKKSPS
jgi:hypothetical protein